MWNMTFATVAHIMTIGFAFTYGPAPQDIIDACRRDANRCIWLTELGPSFGFREPAAPGMCVRIDPQSGKIVEQWNPRQKLHIFWNRNILQSGWFDFCGTDQ